MEAEEYAKSLISKGLISEKEAWDNLYRAELEESATRLHDVCCNKPHEGKRDEICEWYFENASADAWRAKDHAYWVDLCVQMMERTGTNPKQLLNTIKHVLQALQSKSTLTLLVSEVITFALLEAGGLPAMQPDQLSEPGLELDPPDGSEASDESH